MLEEDSIGDGALSHIDVLTLALRQTALSPPMTSQVGRGAFIAMRPTGTGAVTPRKTGANGVVRRFGHAELTSATGGEITIVTHPSEVGFSPIDLLDAALSACLELSAGIAASEDRYATGCAASRRM
ncbi:hypothetical protein ACMDCR_28125 [Labrys okinawensis]|uniref:hypothetical protein n=1 Tax=Labrys okinawensis TaxID=346911 RepID=UPI0039BD888B